MKWVINSSTHFAKSIRLWVCVVLHHSCFWAPLKWNLITKVQNPSDCLNFFAYFGAQISVDGKVYWSLRMNFLFLFFYLSGTQALGIICVCGRGICIKKNHSCTWKAFFLPSNLYYLKKKNNMNLYELWWGNANFPISTTQWEIRELASACTR